MRFDMRLQARGPAAFTTQSGGFSCAAKDNAPAAGFVEHNESLVRPDRRRRLRLNIACTVHHLPARRAVEHNALEHAVWLLVEARDEEGGDVALLQARKQRACTSRIDVCTLRCEQRKRPRVYDADLESMWRAVALQC